MHEINKSDIFVKSETNKKLMKGTYLGEFEEIVLLTVAILNNDAYGLAIKDEIEERVGRKVTISTIHSTLNRLEKKGFLTSYLGGATQKRGGRNKRLFEVTSYGTKAINEAKALRNNLWQAIPNVFWNTGFSST